MASTVVCSTYAINSLCFQRKAWYVHILSDVFELKNKLKLIQSTLTIEFVFLVNDQIKIFPYYAIQHDGHLFRRWTLATTLTLHELTAITFFKATKENVATNVQKVIQYIINHGMVMEYEKNSTGHQKQFFECHGN